ncbi:MAG: hypothetical protein ACYC1Z_03395 [Georgenia sp.]
MPKITHDGVEGVADVPEKVLPFWLRSGWVLVVDEPAEEPPLPAPRPRSRRRAATTPATVPAAGNDSTGGRDHSTTSTEETP